MSKGNEARGNRARGNRARPSLPDVSLDTGHHALILLPGRSGRRPTHRVAHGVRPLMCDKTAHKSGHTNPLFGIGAGIGARPPFLQEETGPDPPVRCCFLDIRVSDRLTGSDPGIRAGLRLDSGYITPISRESPGPDPGRPALDHPGPKSRCQVTLIRQGSSTEETGEETGPDPPVRMFLTI